MGLCLRPDENKKQITSLNTRSIFKHLEVRQKFVIYNQISDYLRQVFAENLNNLLNNAHVVAVVEGLPQ